MNHNAPRPAPLDPQTVREAARLLTDAAAEADVDVRSMLYVAAGREVRGRAGVRAERVLARLLGAI